MPHEWEQLTEAEYAGAALEAARRHAIDVSERRDRYRSLVGEPWLEGPPPQLVMLVKDEDGGRYERRFNLRVGYQPPLVAKYLVEDAVARLPDAPSAIPRSCEEAWQDLNALAWPKAPAHTRATVCRRGRRARVCSGAHRDPSPSGSRRRSLRRRATPL